MRFYIGTDTRTSSEGLYLGSLEITSGKILLIDNIATLNHPSFVSIHPSGNYLYAVSENDNQVYSYMITPTSDDLVLLDKKPTNGSLPCYISTTANGQLLFIANYMGGNCITLQLKKGGLMEISDEIFHEGTGKDPDRQEASHPHSIVPDPLSRFVYVADLGIDKIMIYEIDYKEGKLNPAKIPYQEVRSGSGPRHFVFYNNSGYAYVVNELNSTITAFIVDHELGRLSEIQTISTIPNNFSGTNSAADIHIRGGFLYASNRGHNSIAIFNCMPLSFCLSLNWIAVVPPDRVAFANSIIELSFIISGSKITYNPLTLLTIFLVTFESFINLILQVGFHLSQHR